MNKKILNFIVLLFCILTITGCEKHTNNDVSNKPIVNEVKPLEKSVFHITKII